MYEFNCSCFVTSELENSGIRDSEWQSVIAKHYKHNQNGRTAPGVCSNGSVPLSYSGERRYENWNTHTCVAQVTN